MARIDSILGIVIEQRATELRLGTDRLPKMFARGEQKKLAIPETSEEMLRHLLGPLLSDEREKALGESARVEFAYDAPNGTFQVTLTARRDPAGAREPGFDIVFLRSAPRQAQDGASAAQPPPPAPVSSVHAVDLLAPPAAAPIAFAASHDGTMGPELMELLARAVALRASDVHLLTGHVPSLRIDGRLRPLSDLAPADVDALLHGFLSPAMRERLREGRSVDFALGVPSLGRFRVNAYPTADGLAAALRLLARDAPSLASLHLPAPLDDLVDLPHGLVIVCGPTGSGKSTTLAALAQEALRRRAALLIGLEDPIEYVLSPTPAKGGLVRQRQLGRDVRDFATGLRDALREDPDILLIGEMRDPESITLALTAAETGHLVLTSLHSRSAASAVERIVDAYPPERQQQIRVQLADALRAVVAQRLLPQANGAGRIPALEILRGTHNVASLIREGRTAQINSAIQSGKKDGMLPLERCLADMVRDGRITLEHARAVANEPASFATYLRG